METVIADRESVLNRRRPDRPHVVHSRDLAGRFRLTSKFISAKFVLCGEERYSGAFGRRQVVPGRYLLAASDAPLEVDIKPGSRGFCAYFDVESVAELLRDRVEGEVLPSPLADPNAWTTVLPVVGSQFGRELYDFAVSGKTTNHDYCCELLAEALAQFINTASRLSYRKDASRIENFSRLERARAYLSEEPDRTVTLQEAAREACMSQHRSYALSHRHTVRRRCDTVKISNSI